MQGSVYKILLIGDGLDRKEVKRCLKESEISFDLKEACETNEGISLLDQNEFDCVILDYRLPGIDGLNFLKKMREEFKRKEPAIVMLTGEGSEAVAVEAMKTGARDYVIKENITPERIAYAVRNAITILNSERKNLLLQEELKRSNKELVDFAKIVSHDLKAPLRHIMSFAQLICDEYKDQLNESGQEYISQMQKSGKRMYDMIDSLLQYSRVGGSAKAFEVVDLNSIVAEVVAEADLDICEKKAELKVENLPKIKADAVQMKQLFQNLIGNALKYHKKDASPIVQVKHEPTSNDTLCQIVVQDNGIGFEAKYIDRIFSPFQRLVGFSEYEGFGMGLAIVKKIIDRHQGIIDVHSIPGQGTAFKLSIPLQQNSEIDKGFTSEP